MRPCCRGPWRTRAILFGAIVCALLTEVGLAASQGVDVRAEGGPFVLRP